MFYVYADESGTGHGLLGMVLVVMNSRDERQWREEIPKRVRQGHRLC
jgi:hypothetical protein